MDDHEADQISREDREHQLYSKLTMPSIMGQQLRWKDGVLHVTMDFSAPPPPPDLSSLKQAPYVYDTLPTASSIRLLQFGVDGVSCELITTALESAPDFVALSYTWGPPTFTEVLPLSQLGAQHAFPITKNAWHALEDLGLTLKRAQRMLWVDAICINQQDKAERASQVGIMRNIYAKATRVYIWLGAPTKESDDAIEKILEWGRSRDHQVETYKQFGKLELGQKVPLSLGAFADMKSEATWAKIDALLAREWWSRAWIVQEATSNPCTFMFCGKANLHIDHFFSLYDVIPRFRSREPRNADQQVALQLPFQLGRIRKLRAKEGSDPFVEELSFLQALQHMRVFQSTDPCDKVYTAFALCPKAQNLLKVDYTTSLQDLYINVVRVHVANSKPERALGFLSYAIADYDPSARPNSVFPKRTEENLPSWVPDWRMRLLFTPLARQITGDSYSTKNAYRASSPTKPSLRIDGSELHIRGFAFDVIDKVSMLLRSVDLAAKLARKDPNPPGFTYITGQSFREMTLHMVCADLRVSLDGKCTRGYKMDWDLIADDPTKMSKEQRDERQIMATSFNDALCVRAAGYTERGYCGLVPDTAIEGDRVVVLYGGQVLYLIRDVGDGKHSFVGECYLHGLMDGEAFRFLGAKGGGLVKEEDFVII